MRSLLSLMLCVGISGIAWGQNQIIAPSGQSVKIVTDTVVLNGSLKIANTLSLSAYRVAGIRKTAAGELNSFIGANSGNLTMTGRWNTFLGENVGKSNTTGSNNTFLGTFSGSANTAATANVYVGYKSGLGSTTGKHNISIGNTSTARGQRTGDSNIHLGLDAGWSDSTGFYNVYIGRTAAVYNRTGTSNTIVGFGAGGGPSSLGAGNVFLGAYAGQNEAGNNKLHITNTYNTMPLVFGDFPPSASTGGKLIFNAQVGIGVTNFPATAVNDSTSQSVSTSAFKLFVNGGMLSKALTVNNTWADYVFDEQYQLKALPEVESYIKENGHLSGVPSAKGIEMQGLNLGEVARIQQEKIEELTLYLIDQKKRLLAQQEIILKQMARVEKASIQLGK